MGKGQARSVSKLARVVAQRRVRRFHGGALGPTGPGFDSRRCRIGVQGEAQEAQRAREGEGGVAPATGEARQGSVTAQFRQVSQIRRLDRRRGGLRRLAPRTTVVRYRPAGSHMPGEAGTAGDAADAPGTGGWAAVGAAGVGLRRLPSQPRDDVTRARGAPRGARRVAEHAADAA